MPFLLCNNLDDFLVYLIRGYTLDKQQGAVSMKKRFAAFVSTVLAAVLCACSAAPKDVLPNKAAQPTEAPTQQAQTTQTAPTEQPTPEPDSV